MPSSHRTGIWGCVSMHPQTYALQPPSISPDPHESL
jgi:hypothetical protein